ncbi:glycoside hydrolase family 1 protein [Marinilactibacillus sp. XAAS-LB27]|uniref:glycoside hydrolase family 1 protein n=1 Tax=Marinilactibacillus sp. XAAS-LB27 TaxID=3114538 RepID=UPI002E18F8F3|nr:glycoside hydrolase family 1 protein [Marinilactibacillus sp. XAAS-LB27]
MANPFPEHFFWGAATSAPQSEGGQYEGGRSASTWDKWFELEPENFNSNQGPKNTTNVFDRYKEDTKLMSDINLNSYRTSISWNRLLPDGKTLNPQAVQYYRDYFKRLRDQGVEPIINLFHFDMPWWLMEKGGWENRESIDHFAFYARIAFEQFGDLVHYWTTFNEPIVHVTCGYLGEYHWPKVNNLKRAVQVAHHTNLAHAAAVVEFRKLGIEGKIGNILNLSPVYAKSNQAEDLQAKLNAETLHVKSFLEPTVNGEYPEHLITLLKDNDLLPHTLDGDKELISKGKVDFLGVNYYQPIRVEAVPTDEVNHPATSLGDFSRHYNWPEKKMNPYRGWEIYPEGIYDIAMMIKEDYGNIPFYISENGMGVSEEERFADDKGIIQDDYRIEFIYDHLANVQKAIDAGANCFGYHLWTFIDCWSWLNGYRNRYGFYRLILETGERIPKKSAFWIKDVIQQNQLIKLNQYDKGE